MVKNARILIVMAVAIGAAFALAPAVEANASGPRLEDMTLEAGAAGPVIRVQTTGVLDTIHYSPQPGVWIVEMPDASMGGTTRVVEEPELGIERAEVAPIEEFGASRGTRLTVWLSDPAQLEVVRQNEVLELVFTEVDTARRPSVDAAAVAVAQPEVTVEDALPESAPPVVASAPSETQVPEAERAVPKTSERPVANESSAQLSRGENLYRVGVARNHDGLGIELTADGALDANVFALEGPDRLVLDLAGVVCRVQEPRLEVADAGVLRVRAAQFRSVPEPVTRVVIDLTDAALATDYQLQRQTEGAVLWLGGLPTPATSAETVRVASNEPAQLPQETAPEPAPDTSAADVAEQPEAVAGANEPAPMPSVMVAAAPAPAVDEPAAAPVTIPPVRIADDAATSEAPNVGERSAEDNAIAWSTAKPSSTTAEPRWEADAPWPDEPEQLVERAPARQVLPSSPGSEAQFETKQVDSEERRFTGDPISLSLKDADIKDILKMFATLTNLNIVLDRGVSGSVTVELKDVPWDQALDLILRINNLDYTLENNVLRVAPLRQLEREREARAMYLEQQALSGPMTTVVRPLSYATAKEVAGLLKGGGGGGQGAGNFLLSPRGVVVVNDRTNTLIIRELSDRVEGLMALIDTLDTPTPQVVIEARIVETTRDFSERLGVNWGFSSVMDAEHGNDTGLDFPNSIEIGGGVGLGVPSPGRAGTTGDALLAFTFADILNTFNLDFQLTAAESDGLVKVISTPKITAQNNQTAEIQSGVQLPVQTVANNTTTVQYIDVTLSLNVTPQITAEGTIMLDVQIAKREPAVGLAVTGGQNAPITTRDAQTKVLVRDGGTTVIGGIYQINDQTSQNAIPVLNKIPVIGWLFRNREVTTRHDELLIFITPRIMKY